MFRCFGWVGGGGESGIWVDYLGHYFCRTDLENSLNRSRIGLDLSPLWAGPPGRLFEITEVVDHIGWMGWAGWAGNGYKGFP